MRSSGDSVARYTIVTLLGRGGMGEVYEAEDKVLKRRVALKLLPSRGDEDAQKRLLREARAAAAFDHPNVVTVFDAGVVGEGSDAETYIAMELVRGRSLRACVGDKEIPLSRRIRWLADAARALAAAHRQGLVHRDVKPDNLMIKDDGRIKILDFGIAKQSAAAVDASAPTEVGSVGSDVLTEKGSFVGTHKYAAPEQLRGETVDGRSDQYAWAVTAYELLSGVPPFDADSITALLSRILTTSAPKVREKVPTLAAEVDDTVMRALAKDRDDRFPSLDEAAEAIEPFAERSASTDGGSGPLVSSKKRGVVTRTARGAFRVFFWIAAAIGTLIIGVIVVGAIAGKLNVDVGTPSTASAKPSEPTPTSVTGFRCQDAIVSGAGATKEVAHTLGIGACARLAIEIGQPWAHEGARGPSTDLAAFAPVNVEVALGPTVKVTIKVADREASGEAPAPMEAMRRAIAALAPKFAPPALGDAERAAWGAKDDESARRIEHMWRRLVLGDLQDAEVAIRGLVASDGDSPWPHAMMCLVAARGSASSKDACKAATERLGKVSPTRSKALEAIAMVIGDATKQQDAVRLFRQTYREAPDDADVAGLYGAIVLDIAPEEGYGVVDSVAERFPSYAMIPLSNGVLNNPIRDKNRNAKYMARLNEIIPEKACAAWQFSELLFDGELDEARRRLGVCNAVFGAGDIEFLAGLIETDLSLAALEPERALELAKSKLSDPRDPIRSEAHLQMFSAYVLGGRFSEAIAAIENDMDRLRDQDSPRQALNRAVGLLLLRTALGKGATEKLEKFLREALKDKSHPPYIHLRIEAFLATATGKHEKKELEALAKRVVDSDIPADAFYAIPLLRRAYGDKKTKEILDERLRASTRSRIVSALDVATLLEALKAPDAELEAQYRLAMTNSAFDVAALDKIVARFKLAALCDRTGRKDEAQKLRAEIDKAWAKADPNARALVGAK